MPDIKTPVVANLCYQFVWHTKFLAPILVNDIRTTAVNLILECCSDNKMTKLDARIGKNYVYIKLSCPARLSPSTIMQLLKGRSSKYLQEMFPHLKEMDMHGSVWDGGYFVSTYGNTSDEAIKNYILQPPRGL